mmetsp:Transcript_44398/g.105858  ORF Transcript_44398/g.105858 Transcript_44398/m.105858 type:complete len:253 (+) Transcript_44398:2171-2929(+)
MGINDSLGFDQHITIFSPQGRLLQIEYAIKSSQKFGSTCIALKGKDSICFVLKSKKKFLQEENPGNLKYISLGNFKGSICSGLNGDIEMQLKNMIILSTDFYGAFGKKISSENLAFQVSEKNQINTQQAFIRPLGIKTMICGIEFEMGPQLYKCDPSGQYFSKWLCAVGKKEDLIEYYVEKFKNFGPESWNGKQLIIIALLIFMRIEGRENNADDLNVIICKKNNYDFKKLNVSSIDTFLCLIKSLNNFSVK